MSVRSAHVQQAIPEVLVADTVIFCDFDQTYLVRRPSTMRHRAIVELEHCLLAIVPSYRMLVGWVSGSSLQSIVKKISPVNLRLLPHFIASKNGAGLSFISPPRPAVEMRWSRQIRRSGYSSRALNSLLRKISSLGVLLHHQRPTEANGYADSFYYMPHSTRRTHFAERIIRRFSELFGVGCTLAGAVRRPGIRRIVITSTSSRPCAARLTFRAIFSLLVDIQAGWYLRLAIAITTSLSYVGPMSEPWCRTAHLRRAVRSLTLVEVHTPRGFGDAHATLSGRNLAPAPELASIL
jgi:hypothetical protein